MKIDYIIPTWNSEKTIEECLIAIRKFGNPNKIIIVDNESTDQTVKIARNYDCEILYDTKSLGSARKKGLKAASTKWIGFIDSDVIISDGWYSKILNYVNEDIGAIQGRKLSTIAPFREIEKKKIKKIFEKKRYYDLNFGDRGYTDNTILQRDIVLKADIENINAFEDYIITQTILENGYKWRCVPVFSDHYETKDNFIKKPGWHSSGLKYLIRNNKITLFDFLKIFIKYDAWYLIDGITSLNYSYLNIRLRQLKNHWIGLIQSEKLFKLER